MVFAAAYGAVAGVIAGWLGHKMANHIQPATRDNNPSQPAHPWLTCLAAAGVVAAVSTGFTVLLPRHLWPVCALLTVACVVLAVTDLRVRRLPDVVVLPLYPAVVALLSVAGMWSGQWPVVRAVAGAVLWAVVLVVPWLATAGAGVGFGDVKLSPVLGGVLGWVGWPASMVGLVAGVLLGAFVGVVMLVVGRARWQTAIPYGPMMIAGAGVGLFAGQPLWDAYLRVAGLA